MKKYALAVSLILGIVVSAFAGWLGNDEQFTFTASGAVVSAEGKDQQTINKPDSRSYRNCFLSADVSASNFPSSGWSFSILEGALTSQATIYYIDVTTGTLHLSWPLEYPLCLTPGLTGYFQITASSVAWKMNGNGFIKKP